MKRTFLSRLTGPGAQAQAQLAKLTSALVSVGVKVGAKPTVASLATATMHTPRGGGAGFPHSEGCPVNQKLFPLTAIQDEQSFMTKPCPLCLRQRVNYLASEVFCADFERRCTRQGKERENERLPPLVLEEVEKAFGEFANFEKECLLFAANAGTPSRTWLVYHPRSAGGRLALVNLQGNQLPLAFGLWPLAVINMTEQTLCTTLEHLEAKSAKKETEAPSWSRAARNPAGRIAAVPDVLNPDTADNLATVRRLAAKTAFTALNWDFMEAQLREAKTYYSSPARSEAQSARRKAVEEGVARDALKHLKDSGKVIITAKGMEQEGTTAIRGTVPEANAAAPIGVAAQETVPTSTLSDRDGELPKNEEERKRQEAALTEAAQATTSAAASTTEPTQTQLADGTWEYRYPNGDVTLVVPDGTQVFRTTGLTTTLYPNGNTLYEYADKSSILDRADGVRVTTSLDGKVTEEPIGSVAH